MQTHDHPKDATINMRIHSGMRDFIDYAAGISGKDRSDFMLEAAYEKAQNILLDKRAFTLDEAGWQEFNAVLDAPPAPNEKLKHLLATSAPWE